MPHPLVLPSGAVWMSSRHLTPDSSVHHRNKVSLTGICLLRGASNSPRKQQFRMFWIFSQMKEPSAQSALSEVSYVLKPR